MRWEEYEGKGAIQGVAVWLESDQGKKKATTNAKGEYEFEGLFPGQYLVWADMPGKLGGGEPVDLTLARQSCATAVFVAEESGSISGILRDAHGQTVKHVWVELLRASNGKRIGIKDGFSDENGRYMIRHVPKGEYVIGVHVTHSPSGTKYLWRPYQRNYYPGVSDANAARTISIDSAQVVTGVDWTIGTPLRARVIRGVVLGPDNRPAWPVSVELKVDGYEDNAALAETTKEGVFSLEGLTELQYFVQASSGWREGSEAWHCHKLVVPGGNEVLTIKLDRPGKDCDSCRRRR